MSMLFEGYDKPFFHEQDRAWIVKETEDWVFSVQSEIFNDRVLISTKEEHGRLYTAGFCYDKNGLAMPAAMVWDPTAEQYPPFNPKRIAYDGRKMTRDMSDPDRYDSAQYICQWCSPDVSSHGSAEHDQPELCAACGSLREVRLHQLESGAAVRLRFPRWK